MLNQRIRIFSSLLIAFIIVNFYANFTGIKETLADFKLPNFNVKKLFTLNFPKTKKDEWKPLTKYNQDIKFVETTIEPTQIPSPTIHNNLQPFLTPTPYRLQPTAYIKPTNIPKPTKVPTPPPITSDTRPGSTLAEIFADVSKRECIPAALLYAFQTQETGPWWPIDSPSSKVKIYNTYGWWTDGTGNSCTGMGYHTQTGIVPEDAVDAGTSCQNPIPSGDDQAIMGLWQISKYEEDAAKKYMTGIIKGNIDRRVLFDNAVIFAIITKNRLGNPPTNCNDWPTDAISTAAEKHYGSCGDNYCANILKYYKQFKSQGL
jgi:hypothetical protein